MRKESDDMPAPLRNVVALVKCLLVLSVAALVVSIGGYITSQVRNSASMATVDPDSVRGYRAYGEVPIPGAQTLHLPAGKVAITFHAETVGVPRAGLPIPDLKLNIDGPDGVADPKVTESSGETVSFNDDAWRQVWVADIPRAGDYRITADGQVTAFVSARLAFGYANFSPTGSSGPAGNLLRISQITFALSLLTLIACALAVRALSGRREQFDSEATLFAMGRRGSGVLNAFRDTGRTVRSSGKTATRPEFLDDPLYAFDVELQLPDQAPVRSRRSVQRVPRAEVPTLAVGRKLTCIADAAKPSRRFVIDWGDMPPTSADRALANRVAPLSATALAPPASVIVKRLKELDTLHAGGAISDAEYSAKRENIIADL